MSLCNVGVYNRCFYKFRRLITVIICRYLMLIKIPNMKINLRLVIESIVFDNQYLTSYN